MPLLHVLLLIVLLFASATDLLWRKVPNAVTFSGIVFLLLCHALLGGLSGLGFALAGFAVGMALLLPLFLLRGMGAGDVKLLGAVGAALGPADTINAFLLIAFIGGLYGLAMFATRKGLFRAFARGLARTALIFLGTRRLSYAVADAGGELPSAAYAVAIAAGTLGYLGLQAAGMDFWSVL